MLRVIALTLFLPATAQAQSFVDCDHFAANARNLTQPFADATRTYANGAISLLSLDTGASPRAVRPTSWCWHRTRSSRFASVSF